VGKKDELQYKIEYWGRQAQLWHEKAWEYRDERGALVIENERLGRELAKGDQTVEDLTEAIEEMAVELARWISITADAANVAASNRTAEDPRIDAEGNVVDPTDLPGLLADIMEEKDAVAALALAVLEGIGTIGEAFLKGLADAG
jgi:hypothetical protein